MMRDGTVLDASPGLVLSAAPHRQSGPDVSWNGFRWLVPFTDYRIHHYLEPGIGDVMATRVESIGFVSDPDGLVVAADPLRPEGAAAVAGSRGAWVVADCEVRQERPWGAWRTVTRFLGPALSLGQLHRGQPTTLSVDGAEPGDRVHYLFSLVGSGAGPCIPQLGGLCLDLLPPITKAGSVSANANGAASLLVTVPSNAPLTDVWAQAVLARGALSGKTLPVTAPILP